MNNWDEPSNAPQQESQQPTPNELMELSPDTSFTQDGSSTLLQSRHAPLPTPIVLQPRRPLVPSQPIDFNKELHNITSTQSSLHSQLGFILTKLDSLSPSASSPSAAMGNNNNTTSPPTRESGGWN